MSDVIQLLPDAVANQIAAGEVIQRPASVVKELVENAVDAGSTDVKVVVKEAGRSLIQVVDNGCGMSETDARLSFERHATSKIREATDLFAIRTMGFRGEALASIAAVAQTELRTKRKGDDLGVSIQIAGSQIEVQEAISCPEGSNFLIKNLFFNVPARRRFLKTNSTELRHIITEFQRIALANPDVAFSLVHNDVTVFQLPATNLRQRVVNLIGKSMNSQLVPVETETTVVKIYGFIGKPECARKTAGDQFFFVNQRYMRHPYLHKAIMEAYTSLISSDALPAYFLYLEVDPEIIDVNIHPTKTEIKFEDERSIWHILNASVRESLGKYNFVPSIDFDTADMVDIPVANSELDMEMPEVKVNPQFNPFDISSSKSSYSGGGSSSYRPSTPSTSNWEQLYQGFESESGEAPFEDDDLGENNEFVIPSAEPQPIQQTFGSSINEDFNRPTNAFFQFKNKYILTSVKSGLMVIDQKRAHERILFERFLRSIHTNKALAQQSLFPETLAFSPDDAIIINEIIEDIRVFGFDLESDGSNGFLVKGMPSDMSGKDPGKMIDSILEAYKTREVDAEEVIRENMAKALARNSAIGYGKVLDQKEMSEIIDQLFACSIPNYSPDNKTIVSIISVDELDKRLG